MWRVMAAGSGTATRRALTLPLGAWVSTAARNCLRSAKWFGPDTRVRGSPEMLLRYQLKRALPSSPREFLGCGVWLTSTFTTGPTMRTERPRKGIGNSGFASVGGLAVSTESATMSPPLTLRVRRQRDFGTA